MSSHFHGVCLLVYRLIRTFVASWSHIHLKVLVGFALYSKEISTGILEMSLTYNSDQFFNSLKNTKTKLAKKLCVLIVDTDFLPKMKKYHYAKSIV